MLSYPLDARSCRQIPCSGKVARALAWGYNAISVIKGLIFDFDGLILDTELPVFQAWQEIYQSYGCYLPLSSWAMNIGVGADLFDPYADLERQLGRPVDREGIRGLRRQRQAERIEAQPVLQGVHEYIADAKGLGLGVGLASSSSRDWVVGHLTRLGLEQQFDSIKCSDDVQLTKPDPELYLANLDSLGIQAGEAVALEDSPNGIASAKAAGIFCVVVPNVLTSQLPLNAADLRLASLAEIPLGDLLRKVAANER